MSYQMLDIYAGSTALRTLQQSGFDQSAFSTLLGASGGPKWFVLFGLDKYLMTDFFRHRTTPLFMLGSSVGSFRAACFAQRQPVAAIERLAKRYIETTYGSKYVSPREVTESVRDIVDAILEDDGVSNILDNPIFKAHFIVSRAKGLVASEYRLLQGLGLLRSSRINKRSRSRLQQQYDRILFQPSNSSLTIEDPYGIPTQSVALTATNTAEAILASGSLPIIMQGVKDIDGAPPGRYRDGGIVDYHFDIKVNGTANNNDTKHDGNNNNRVNDASLLLYPHFSASLRAGWFDKKLTRLVNPQHYERVVLLCPSAEFINSLPYGKIPDRADFSNLGSDERMKFWWQAAHHSENLATEFADFLHKPDWKRIRPITDLTAGL